MRAAPVRRETTSAATRRGVPAATSSSTAPKGEITVVLGPGEQTADAAEAREAVTELVAAGTPRRVAADVVSRLTGTARNELYRATL